MRKFIYQFAIFCSVVVLSIGCSSGNNPVITNDSGEFAYLPVGVSDYDADQNPINGYGILGLFEVNVDVGSLTGEVQSLRETSSTEVLEIVDITNFLTMAPCGDCVKLMGVELSPAGNVILKIGIKHPFGTGDSSKPISGQNRGDLHVFNVEGQVLIESMSSTNFPGIGALVDNLRLVNADGLSRYLDGVLDTIIPTTANVHPYKLHFDDYSAGNYDPLNPMGFQSVTTPPPSGNLVMAMGSDYDVQPYEFDLSSGNLNFALAVGCTYGVSSDSKLRRFTPEYRVPQHLKKAASEVSVRIVSNNLYAGDPLSTADLAIDVVDISHGVAVGTSLNQMLADSSVGGISLAIPGVLSAVKTVPLTNTGGTGHDSVDPLTYEITIKNEQSAPAGTYSGLVKVADTYAPGQNTSPELLGKDGIRRVNPTQSPLEGLFVIPEFATYQVFDIEVTGIPNDLPTAILLPNPVTICEGQSVNYDGTTSFDPDGAITWFEFDYVWDLVEAHFSADAENDTGTVVSVPYPTAGSYTAGLRVTDNQLGVDYAYVDVTVEVPNISCPNVTFAGGAISSNFTYNMYHSFSGLANWGISAGANIDADMLSTGNGICIYSESGIFSGEMRYFTPQGTSYTAVGSDYPGEQGVSIDVDSTDLVVFVTCGSTYFPASNSPGEVTLNQRINASNNYFKVVDPFTGPSSYEKTVNVGTKIMAIDIDANNDVWVLDTNNIM
ncbi:MAG: PKD domain-containing protein, partial [bacterium]